MSVTEKQSRPPLVIVANDQEWSARSLESLLGPNGYAVLRAYTGRQALELARSAQPDVIILDSRMPDLDGIDVCRMLRDDPRVSAATPIIITTSGPAGRAQRLTALEAGAWEYFSQPLDGEVLLHKLKSYMRSRRELEEARDQQLLDHVSGLYNVRGLARRARELGAEAQRQHHSLACVAFTPVLDAPYDDRAEESFAARVAAHLGEIFRRAGRASDAIGRIGPSEFGIVAPATEAAGAVRLVERFQESVEAVPISYEGEEHTIKIRAGYYAVPDFAESSVDAVEMLLRAATALRHAHSDADLRIRAFDDLPVRSAQ